MILVEVDFALDVHHWNVVISSFSVAKTSTLRASPVHFIGALPVERHFDLAHFCIVQRAISSSMYHAYSLQLNASH